MPVCVFPLLAGCGSCCVFCLLALPGLAVLVVFSPAHSSSLLPPSPFILAVCNTVVMAGDREVTLSMEVLKRIDARKERLKSLESC